MIDDTRICRSRGPGLSVHASDTRLKAIARKAQRLETLLAGAVELAASIQLAIDELQREALSHSSPATLARASNTRVKEGELPGAEAGRQPYISTERMAEVLGMRPASIRAGLCRNKGAHYMGLRPIKLPNRRLLWPADDVEHLVKR